MSPDVPSCPSTGSFWFPASVNRSRYWVHGISYVDERLMMFRDSVSRLYYYVLDRMYNVRRLVDRAGALVERYLYDGYGRPYIRELCGRRDMDNDTVLGSTHTSRVADAKDGTGWVQQVIRKIEGDPNYYRSYFMYDTAGHPWILLRDRWTLDGSGQPTNCTRTLAREYRYDSGRARYLVRDLDTTTLLPSSAEAGTWTDYDGDSTYGDYFFPSAETTSTSARYTPGIWEKQGSTLRGHHGDQIGSSRAMTDSSAAVVRRTVYTAFGERILEDNGGGEYAMAPSRYGYAGAWGYEQDLAAADEDPADLGFIHIGERWYDPGSGRFLQRDPIGIGGGLNVYAYVVNEPIRRVDPTGLTWVSTVGTVLDNAASLGAGVTGVLVLTANPGAPAMGAASGVMKGCGWLLIKVDATIIVPMMTPKPAPPAPPRTATPMSPIQESEFRRLSPGGGTILDFGGGQGSHCPHCD